MFTLPPALRIYVATTPTDMRKSFDGLSAAVTQIIGQDHPHPRKKADESPGSLGQERTVGPRRPLGFWASRGQTYQVAVGLASQTVAPAG
jgi:hypothetical protein